MTRDLLKATNVLSSYGDARKLHCSEPPTADLSMHLWNEDVAKRNIAQMYAVMINVCRRFDRICSCQFMSESWSVGRELLVLRLTSAETGLT